MKEKSVVCRNMKQWVDGTDGYAAAGFRDHAGELIVRSPTIGDGNETRYSWRRYLCDGRHERVLRSEALLCLIDRPSSSPHIC